MKNASKPRNPFVDLEDLEPPEHELAMPSLDLRMTLNVYFRLLVFVMLPGIFIYEETSRPGGMINALVRRHVYGQGNIWDYLAEDPHNVPYDDEVPECDYRTMTAKRFYNDFVR